MSKAKKTRKSFVLLSLLTNLGLLGFFKYGGFLVHNFSAFMILLGFNYTPAAPNIILPVGISFYTFQTLSYTLDVYRGSLRPSRSFLDYALYVTFFPQLVAGPIVRASDFLPQCEADKRASPAQLKWGVYLFILGLFNKVVVADTMMSTVVEKTFDTNISLGFLEAWSGAFSFSIQIFCDFAGYSLCAIGLALMLGFVLPDNFRFPYAARGFSDFWRRWHISLSTWLRDYLYISLGGNRRGTGRTYINLMLTMLIGGLWHGASWMFVIWGGLHGAYLVSERFIKNTRLASLDLWSHTLAKLALQGLTYLAVTLAWVFFRADSMERASYIIKSMFGCAGTYIPNGLLPIQYIVGWGGAATIWLIHAMLRGQTLELLFNRCPVGLRVFIIASLVFLIMLAFNGEDRAFIYFQF